MLISDVSIKRPVFATMLNVVLIVFGLFSLPRLGIDQMPNVDFPVITVSVIYPGADPESVEQRVLEPLEKAVNGIAGLDKLMATAYPSLASVVLQFKLEKNSDQAAQEVRDKIFAAVGQLPPEAETPIVQKFDIGGAPIINIALTGEGVPFAELSALGKDVVQPALQRVDGIANVNTAGIRPREVLIRLDRDRMASFGVTPADVADSIRQQNLDVPSGRVTNDQNYWTLRVKGRLQNGAEIAQLPVITRSNANIRIADVASVEDAIAEEKTAAFLGKTPTILMSIQKQAGGNTTAIADGAKAAIAKLSSQMPKGAKLEIITDNSRYIKGSIDSVKLDLVLGAVLATFIVLVFLRNLMITIISAVALPTAVIATFAFLDFKGFTLNMMSTLGLSLSIGILIDDAIIVIENIARHLGMGKSGPKAAKDAMDEIGLAVLATTLTIGAVFVPVAFMEGIIGRFFYQFGLTVAFAVFVSLFVAFTLTPMLSARLLSGDDAHHKSGGTGFLGRLSNAIEKFLTSIESGYKRLLNFCLNNRVLTLVFGFCMFVLSIVMLRFVPVAFFPKEDRSQFNIALTLPEGTALETTKKRAMEVVDAMQVYPGVSKVVTAVAATRDAQPNKARLDIVLVDPAERTYSQEALMNRVREEVAPKFRTDGTEFLVAEEGGGGGGGRQEPLQFIFKSDDWPGLIAYTDKMKDYVAKEVPFTIDVNSSKPKVQKEFRVQVDPARAADVGVSPAQIGATLRALFEGDKVGEIEDRGVSYDVRMRITDKDRLSPEDIAGVTLPTRTGNQVTLGAIANIQLADAPSSIERFDGQRNIVVYGNFTGKDLNAAADQILGEIKKTMPPGITMTTSGQTEIMKNAMFAMLKALGIAVLLVYMILCAQYERYLAPLVIMAALPLSFTGAFGSLLITGQVMSVYTMIGIILLMGIVTKNGILLIDFTMQRMREGLALRDALMEAGPIRLRPILMTTFAAGGGMIPIAVGHGVGGEARSPMGVAVIGGLLMSTFLTLVVVPCVFSLVEGMMKRLRKWRGKDDETITPDWSIDTTPAPTAARHS